MTDYPNILFISGSGKKVGKTYLACEIIKRISEYFSVTAIKITPHKYEINISSRVVYHSERITITEEFGRSQAKDSNLMLNAGADKVYFIQAEDSDVPDALEMIQLNKDVPVICETGGAGRFLTPGMQIFVDTLQNTGLAKNKEIRLKSNLIVRMDEMKFDFDIDRIIYYDKKWKIK